MLHCAGKSTFKLWAPLFVAVFELLFISVILALFIGYYANLASDNSQYNTAGFALPVVCSAVAIAIIVIMVLGVISNKPLLIIPHLVAQILAIVIMTTFVSFTFLLIFVGKTNFKTFYIGEDFVSVYLTMAALCGLMTLAEVWFFFVVKNSYDTIKSDSHENIEHKQIDEANITYWRNYWNYWISNMMSIECPKKLPVDDCIVKNEKETLQTPTPDAEKAPK